MGAAGNKKPKKEKHGKHVASYELNETETSATTVQKKKK